MSETAALPQRVPRPLLLYSATTYLKFRVQEDYRGHHYAWCSAAFDAGSLGRYSFGAGTPPSSNPASICRDLRAAVAASDEHNEKIASQKKVLLALAVDWQKEGAITEAGRDDITAIVTRASFNDWRPLLFVVPYANVEGRVDDVPRLKRASMEPEYIVADLMRNEFDIIEPIT